MGLRRVAVGVVLGVALLGSSVSASAQDLARDSAQELVAQTEPQIDSKERFAVELLQRGGWPLTGSNVCAVVGWELAEGGHFIPGSSTFNPLNTSQAMLGDSVFNSHGVRNYPNWNTGLDATVKTLQLGYYDYVRLALMQGDNALGVLQAVGTSVWGTKFENPGAFLSNECMTWAQDFDKKSEAGRAEVARAKEAIATARQNLSVAQEEESRLNTRYQKVEGPILEAKQKLSAFARSLYMAGLEPTVLSDIEAFDSGDPMAYTILQSYTGYAANTDAREIHDAVLLLETVGSSRKSASEKVQTAQVEITKNELAQLAAEKDLARIESALPFGG
jgi:hypothetical protein